MPVHFYIAEAVDNSAERQALFYSAQLLSQKFGHHHEELTFIANIPPQNSKLPQLDAVLMSSKFIALIDFKSVADPIINPESEKGTWYALDKHNNKKYPLHGGRSANPRIQARKAHYQWSLYLRAVAQQIMHPQRYSSLEQYWNHLKGWVLFSPHLHPQTPPIPNLGYDHLWLEFRSISDIVELVFSSDSYLRLNPTEQRDLAYRAFNARPWQNLQALLNQVPVGYLQIATKNGPINYPLHRFERFSLGRSSQCTLRIEQGYKHVSRRHATLEIGQEAVRFMDAESSYGSYINQQKISSSGVLLRNQDEIWLGPPSQAGSCRLVYQSADNYHSTMLTSHTTQM